MSVTDRYDQDASFDLDELPEFELSYLFDDKESPDEITVFPESNAYDISTHWITVDASTAIPLERVR